MIPNSVTAKKKMHKDKLGLSEQFHNDTLAQYRLGGAVVRALDLRSIGRGFDSRPLHRQATTLGKLFTPMCLCSPSSIIWYLARAFMLMRLCGSHLTWGPMNKGSIVVAVLQ